jgi:predicted permease
MRFRGALVAAQMTLACVLCFVAVLLLRSSLSLDQRDHGFHPSGVLTFELMFPRSAYSDDRMAAFYAQAQRKLREIPGVQAAGFATSVPWTGYDENTVLELRGYTPRPGESMQTRYQAAGPGFFESLGTRVLSGRTISERDTGPAPKAAVVNEALVRRYLSDVNPLGRVVDLFGQSWTIVGVVEDVRDHPADAAAKPAMWTSLEQLPYARIRGAVRASSGDPSSLAQAVNGAIASIDPALAVARLTTLLSIADVAIAERRFTLWWCAAFAGLAVALGTIGIYSLMAYSAQQRTREIGIRMALGATRRRVVGAMFASGFTLALAGVVAGALASPAAGRGLASLLYGVTPADRISLVLAMGAILFAAGLASAVPAWGAARTEPLAVLREQ